MFVLIICSEIVTEVLKQYQHLMEGAMRDIDRFCEEQSWLTEIHRFTLHVVLVIAVRL